MERKIRIGIIGTGGIAGAHMEAYRQFDDVQVVAGADIVPGKARTFFEKWEYPALAFDGAAEMLREVELDGVSICTYNTTHAECALMAFEAGLHVQCEKPMSFTLQEAADMVRASRKAGKMLTIGFQPRYDTARRKVDGILASGALGKVYYIQSGGGRRRFIPGGTFIDSRKAGFGCLGDIGCYSIDECLHGVGYPKPLTVSAMATDHFGRNPKYFDESDVFDVDDFSTAFVRLEGDATFVFKQSWAMHADSLGDTMWLGTEGGIRIRHGFDYAKQPSRVMYFTDVNGNQVDSFVLPPETDEAGRDPFKAKIRDYCDAIRDGRPAPVPGEEILVNQAILDGIYRSAKLHREVDIDIPRID